MMMLGFGVKDAFVCTGARVRRRRLMRRLLLLLLEARVDSITGIIGDREVSMKSLAYGRRRASVERGSRSKAPRPSRSLRKMTRAASSALALNAAPKASPVH